jgi:hypothetical protein
MAVTLNAGLLAGSQSRSTFTMSLTSGWDLIPGSAGGRPLAAGDLILLEVRKPPPPVTGPPGWGFLGEFTWTGEDGAEREGSVFWKIIGPPEKEIPPMFSAEGAAEWEIRGQALTGYALAGDGVTGSAVPSSLPG